MNKMKSNKGFFVTKVDLSREYYKLRWEFIWRVLQEVYMADNIIYLIMNVVTRVKTNLNWNRVRSEFFRPQLGIRKGDPFSPYLFVMCMLKLSHLILEAVNNKKRKAIKMGKQGPWISHLMFVDDLLLIGEVIDIQMQCVDDIIQTFRDKFRQEVNEEKTNILFSKKVPKSIRERLVQMSKFRET